MSPINRKLTPAEAQDRLARRMARTEISPAAALRRLRTWGLTDDECQSVIDSLRDEDFLNAKRYAQAYVHDKFEFQRWGRLKIRAELQREGIGSNIINKALQTIDETTYCSALREILRLKNQHLDAEDTTTRRLRLMRFAASRGFETELIASVLEDIL